MRIMKINDSELRRGVPFRSSSNHIHRPSSKPVNLSLNLDESSMSPGMMGYVFPRHNISLAVNEAKLRDTIHTRIDRGTVP